MRLQGSTAIVTGGASGLGAATAQALAAVGARVAILDLDETAAISQAASIQGLGIGCDVTDSESAIAAMERVKAAYGPPRLLVCCAGIAPAGRIIGRNGPMPLAAFRRVIDVNLLGSFNILRLAAADMADMEPLDDGERGLVLLTASIAAYEGQIGQSAYAASKAAVAGLVLATPVTGYAQDWRSQFKEFRIGLLGGSFNPAHQGHRAKNAPGGSLGAAGCTRSGLLGGRLSIGGAGGGGGVWPGGCCDAYGYSIGGTSIAGGTPGVPITPLGSLSSRSSAGRPFAIPAFGSGGRSGSRPVSAT